MSRHGVKTELIGGDDVLDQVARTTALSGDDGTRAIQNASDDLLGEFIKDQQLGTPQVETSFTSPTVALGEPQSAQTVLMSSPELQTFSGQSSFTQDDFAGATINLQSQTNPLVSEGIDSETAALLAPSEPDFAATNLIQISPSSSIATTPMSPADATIELDHVKVAIATDPDNTDLLFRLAVLQHRTGSLDESRSTLMKLATAYEGRGQDGHAARIMSMLGASKPQTPPQSSTAQLSTAPTRSLSGQTRGLTGGLNRTAVLRHGTAALGKSAVEASKEVPPPFPPESLTFTIPLPGESQLPDDVREMIDFSTSDLNHGRLNAALDACLCALDIEPGYVPIYLRIAEIYTVQRLTRRARAQAETLLRLVNFLGDEDGAWMIYRVLLHSSDKDLASLRRVVELLIANGEPEQASFYASKLIQLLDSEGLAEESLAYSVRLCKLIPGDTRAALENAILRVKAGDLEGAVDRWESAVASGADPGIARASLAAIMSAINENEFWSILAQVIVIQRQAPQNAVLYDAYERTVEALANPTSSCIAGQGLLAEAAKNPNAHAILTAAAGDRSAPPFARATSAVALAWSLQGTDQVDRQVAAVRTALQLLEDDQVASHPAWAGIVGRVPRFEDLSLQLGEMLLNREDPAGAVQVLEAARKRNSFQHDICRSLADAYFKIGQLGSALTILDELAVHFRNAGQLDPMAAVLRQMSQLAPNNIKVKSRLIDSYLQRGFVAEARAELVQRADLEERSGLIKDAISSLQRAADLSWTIGLADEAFALYDRVIALAPDEVDHRHSLVTLYLQMGRINEAAAHQRAVVDISLRQERTHEAIAALHQVIGLTPDDMTAYYQLGELLASIGEYLQAEKVYRRVVSMNPGDAIAQAKVAAMASLRDQRA
ncbi:MAG: tetratricopeptide repeat protein [Thermomicrobiales bacterium]